MSFHQALDLILELDKTAVGCTWDILRQSDRLDRLSKIPWVVPNFIVIEGEAYKPIVKHFEDFLGTTKPVIPMKSEIFTNTLSMEEAKNIVREVSDDEINDAVFEIDGDKALGLDGFSFEFFKKAWDVIGKDFCSAVKEFFRSGKLLGEINATLIALIPKELLRGYNRVNGPKRRVMKIDIQKCITSLKFSICLNGGIHGYFKGGRGLRQGDPISPYLFTLVMEVFNLIMIKNIAGKSLEEFSKLSSLSANLGKSVIFFGSIKDEVKIELLQILPFKCGKLHVRYLAILGFYLLLPNTVIKDIDKLFKRFLWNSSESVRGKAKVAWKTVCMPKEQGGLGIKPLKRWNEVLLIRQSWKILENKKSLWAEWVNTMLSVRDMIKDHVMYEIEKGNYVSVWYDKWKSNGPLGKFITQRNIYDARLPMDAKVSEMIKDNRWAWPNDWSSLFPELLNIPTHILNAKEDKVLWVTNVGLKICFSIKQAWMDLRDDMPVVAWKYVIWFKQLIPKNGFILWLAIQSVWKEICKLSYKFGDQFKLEELCRELIGRCKESKFENKTWSGIMEGYMLISNNGSIGRSVWDKGRCLVLQKGKRPGELCMVTEMGDGLHSLCPIHDSYEGNVARMKGLLIYCEWGYTLHNDAFSIQSYIIVDDG
nr:hypothetical protein [Tanacetum cinerariifolium]